MLLLLMGLKTLLHLALQQSQKPSSINRRLDDDDVHLHAKIEEEDGNKYFHKPTSKRLDDVDLQNHSSPELPSLHESGPLLDFKPLAPKDVASIETFTFFVGWQRSGHSIIGSLLDGHPDVVIAHEFFLFSQIPNYFRYYNLNRTNLFNKLFKNSFRSSQSYGARSLFHSEKGYNLELANSWQGRFRELKVIGDKTAGDVTDMYDDNPRKFHYMLEGLRQLVTVPIRAINVVRNPFDMIATLTLYRGSNTTDMKVKATEENKYDNPAILRKATKDILRKATALYQIERMLDLDMLRIHSEDFVRAPKEVMSRLCQFLGLQCSEEYLQQCADKTFKTVSRSRHLVKWDPAMISMINEVNHILDFFKRYSFDGE